MKSELLKRSISSLFLISLVFLSALTNDYIFLSILFIVVILSWIEWIKVIGHKETPGRPELLATTKKFLDYFNLKSLSDLPQPPEINTQ